MNFKKVNILTGWIICIIACAVYISTREATVSFWDPGEFISCAYKLQISHAPGAPLFIMLGRLFIILFSGGDPHHAAIQVNLLSSVGSGFTILFLYWTIVHLAKKLLVKKDEVLSAGKSITIIASGVVGALAFTFSDSFWFSAVEGVVWGVSPLFFAMGFWAILKWEDQADQPHADRWIVLIAYLLGLSIGVHLLSLLCIPALVMIYYFRRNKVTTKGTILAFIIACIITVVVKNVIIQDSVNLMGKFEVFFVNSLGLPFNSGSYFCIAFYAAIIIFVLYWAKKHHKYFLRLAFLCIAFIFIGYASFFMILIRANAGVAINMQDVTDPMRLVHYLDRSQYGTWPILYGPDFTAKPTGAKVTGYLYNKDVKNHRYDITGKKSVPEYASSDEHLFPRLWDSDNSQGHVDFYRNVLGLAPGETPSFFDNIKYFFRWQLNWMYIRYFMWNFSGRQNDLQGFGNVRDGNWITGIPFIDNLRLGDQSKMPESLRKNKAHNKLYMLPLLLGICGFFFQLNRDKKHTLTVFILFFFTGIAIVLYLNQALPQPRERDYSYVDSFYAFAIWIGLGVLSIADFIHKKIIQKGVAAPVMAGMVCLLGVPVMMCSQEWNDHDRHHKTLARDIAEDYLNSCKKNAILFTGGDNDTYPLWYAQEVEGVRTDIRIIITTLLGTDWFINQLKEKVNESAPIALDWPTEKYVGDKQDYLYYIGDKLASDKYFNLSDVLHFTDSNDPNAKFVIPNTNDTMNYVPTQNFFLPVDKQQVIQDSMVLPADTAYIVPRAVFQDKKNLFAKTDLAELHIIAANHWVRPIYFTSSYLSQGLNDYTENEGLTYRLVPYLNPADTLNPGLGNMNTAQMYDVIMHKFKFGGAQIPGTYFDEPNRRELYYLRSTIARLGIALAAQGRKDSARNVLEYGNNEILAMNYPYGMTSNSSYGNASNIDDYTSMLYAQACYMAGDDRLGKIIADAVSADCAQQLTYYSSLSENQLTPDLQQAGQAAQFIIQRLQVIQREFVPKASVPPRPGNPGLKNLRKTDF
jgi:hypothetical protein